MNPAITSTWEQRLSDLGNVPASRIVADPPPGTATINDAVRIRDTDGRICEVVDSTLVEKVMGWQESLLAGFIIHWLHSFLEEKNLGVVTGADGMTRLFGDTVRGPDVAYISWDRLPNRSLPTDPIPSIVPNFVVEVLSIGNTYSEMSRKRREYFHAGVELLWMVHPRERSVTIYRTAQDAEVVYEGRVTGEQVLPGWFIDCEQLFSKLDQQAP